MKLTPELIQKSPQFTNCLKDRELDLRAAKIAAIENLGATLDQFDVIDLTDNEIRKLDNFPLLQRLGILLLSNNRIFRISEELGTQLPNLHTINLSGNNLQNLNDLDPLATLSNLKNLCLLENNVTKQQRYRLYVIHTIPQLKVLDFKKIKKAEREEAKAVFGAEKKAPSILKRLTHETIRDEQMTDAGLSQEQIKAIQIAIANAQTLDEVTRLEKQLKEGQFPAAR